jgi:hypothetical protein
VPFRVRARLSPTRPIGRVSRRSTWESYARARRAFYSYPCEQPGERKHFLETRAIREKCDRAGAVGHFEKIRKGICLRIGQKDGEEEIGNLANCIMEVLELDGHPARRRNRTRSAKVRVGPTVTYLTPERTAKRRRERIVTDSQKNVQPNMF